MPLPRPARLHAPRARALLLAALAPASLAARPAPVAAQTTEPTATTPWGEPTRRIDTGTPPPAGVGGAAFGHSSPFVLFSVAQSFVAPAGTAVLTGFEFWVRDARRAEDTSFRPYIFAWDDAALRPTGPALWQGAMVRGPGSTVSVPYSFLTAGLLLDPGRRYAALLSSVGTPLPPGGEGYAAVELTGSPTDRYPEGGAFTLVNLTAEGLGGLTSRTATAFAGGGDYAFTATFGTPLAAVVPEPSTVVLAATGLVAIALRVTTARRRARR